MEGLLLSLTPILGKVLSSFFPDPEKRDAATQAILKEVQANEVEIMKTSASVMTADAQADSKFTSSARPAVVYWSLATISSIVVEGAWVGTTHIVDALAKVPTSLWNLVSVGIGGYMLLRTAEKIAPQILKRK